MQLIVRLVTFCIQDFCETFFMFDIRKKCFLSAEIGTGQYSNVDIAYSSFFYYLKIHQNMSF